MSNKWFTEKKREEVVETNIHVMIDIETFGVGVAAPCITIGAVLFDPTKQDSSAALMKRSILIRITPEDAVKFSGGVEGGTLGWWLGQDDAAIKALVGPDAVGMETALQLFRQYCIDRSIHLDDRFFVGHNSMPQACAVWAKSPDFDCKNLEDKYQRVYDFDVERKFPLPFYKFRCVRTLQDLAWPGGPDDVPVFDVGVKHDARVDAVVQALTVQAGYLKLGLAGAKYDSFGV